MPISNSPPSAEEPAGFDQVGCTSGRVHLVESQRHRYIVGLFKLLEKEQN